jgi:flavin-binding protein dodecin
MEREKRSRGSAKNSRQSALDAIKAARKSGTVVEYEVKEIENVFDEVNEEEYKVSAQLSFIAIFI